MKKHIFIISISIICLLIISFFIGTGFMERTDVILVDYVVSDDGTQLTFKAGVPTSMGYIRGFEDKGGGVKPHYLIFHSTFGGLNSSFGAKHEFTLDLGKDDTEIYFNRPDGGYELVLQKNASTGNWEKPIEKLNMPELKEYYIDFAMDNRIDFIPDFDENTYGGDRSVSSIDFLMLTYYLNRDNLPEDNSMKAELVEGVMREHFGIDKVEHKSQFKGWTYLAEEDKYIPYPEGTAEEGLFDVVSFNSYSKNGKEIYEVTLREYSFPFIYLKEDPASIYRYEDCLWYVNDTKNVYRENVSFLLAQKGEQLKNGECNLYEAFYDLIVTDNTDGFTMGNTIKIKYYLDDTTGKAHFLAKQEELSDFVFPEKYDEVFYEHCPDNSYHTRFILVRQGEHWGIINGWNGKEILKPEKYQLDRIYINTYEEVWPLIEVVKDEKHGMLDYYGNMIIEPQYEDVRMDVYNVPNVVFVYDGEKWGGIKLTFDGYINQYEYTAVKASEVDYDIELSEELKNSLGY